MIKALGSSQPIIKISLSLLDRSIVETKRSSSRLQSWSTRYLPNVFKKFKSTSCAEWDIKEFDSWVVAIFSVCTCTIPAGVVLSDKKSVDVLRNKVIFAKLFELEYGVRFTDTKTEGVEADPMASVLRSIESVATCKRHICMAKKWMRYHAAFQFFRGNATDVFGAFILSIGPLQHPVTRLQSCYFALLRFLYQTLTVQKVTPCWRGLAFFEATVQYVSALRTPLTEEQSTSWSSLESSGLNGFPAYKITQSRQSKYTIRMLEMHLTECDFFNGASVTT